MIRETEAYAQSNPGEALEKRCLPLAPGDDDVVIEVAGCGLCHTDLGFLDGSVSPRGPRPLVPGHEVAGEVIWAPPRHGGLLGRKVVVPAVWPCGDCDLCKRDRPNACLRQKMPGNDTPGGFARHMVAPAKWLAPLREPVARERLAEFAVIADAIATPYEATVRANVTAGDWVVVVGTGGLGGFLVQIARVRGARVVALDIDEKRLERARAHGAQAVLCVRGMTERDIRERVRAMAKDQGAPAFCWKIFETSGTPAGQRIAFELLAPASTLVVVGYCRERIEVRLSNLMAYDATAIGVWGCRPTLYPELISLVESERMILSPFVERRRLSEVNDVIAAARAGKLERRVILVPDEESP